MISVAKTIELRISLDALKMTVDDGLRAAGDCAFCFSRRKTFSTSMIASSTSSPMAMARPPSVIVLIVMPK